MMDMTIIRLAEVLADLLGRDDAPPKVYPARYVTVALAAAITGLTDKAIRRKIEDGVWVAGREYMRAPDGAIMVDMQGVEKWVGKGQASK